MTDHPTATRPAPMSVRAPLRLALGGGGTALIGSLLMPWAHDKSGWQLLTAADVFLLITGIVALAAAITGGRFGLFRPDVSLIGAADLFGLAAIVLTGWLASLDFPAGASRGAGVFVALGASIAIACAAGDYRVLRGASWFPRLD